MTEPPLEYTFENIQIGEKRKFNEKIDNSKLETFAKLSGDYNPLHMDEKYAQETSFKRRICHGMLLASFFSRLIGMYLPGKSALYFSQTLNFQAPCFVTDEITIEGEVIYKSSATGIVTIKTSIHNQNDECIVDGIAKVIIRSDA